MPRYLSETDPLWWCRALRLDPGHHEKVAKLARWAGYFARRTLRNDRSGGTWLVLSGPTGTGKTTVGKFCKRVFNDWAFDVMLSGKSNWKMDRRPFAERLNWPAYCDNAERNGSNYRIEEVKSADVIILDDVGAECDRYKSGAPKSDLRNLLESIAGKWLMISTNVPKDDWIDAFGARVADRLDAAKSFSTDGIPSYRSKLNRETK